VDLANAVGRSGQPWVRRLVADARVRDLVQAQLVRRTAGQVAEERWPPAAGAIPRLFSAVSAERSYDAALEIAGTAAVVSVPGDRAHAHGLRYLLRQQASLGGGSNEMQRNLISERVLGMPREPTADHDRPFDQVRHNDLPPRPS
jgi:alkylation response protein AidB-like acyl-CoA dehydrogenase